MISDLILNTTDSPEAKLIVNFMDDLRFDTRARSKGQGVRNLSKNQFNERALLPSG